MEEKKSIKISLSTFFLILAVIVIAFMAYYIYTEKTNANKEIETLEANVVEMQNTIKDLQGKIDSISNTLNSGNTDNTSSENFSDSKYTEITKSLENKEIFLLTDTIKNNDATYTLKGKIITEDTSKELIAEYPFYKETGEYKQITVSSDTKCEYSLDSNEFKTDTVENVFSKKLYFGGGQGACFNFTFENGKCTSVNEIITGH